MSTASSIFGIACPAVLVTGVSLLVIRSANRLRVARRRRGELRADLMRHAKLCLKCGYDVRGSGGRCSECGWPTDA